MSTGKHARAAAQSEGDTAIHVHAHRHLARAYCHELMENDEEPKALAKVKAAA